MMVANVYKCANRSDHQVASSLITGFTGQLKGWWNNSLTEEQRLYLKTTYKTDVVVNFITNEHNQPIEDDVRPTFTNHDYDLYDDYCSDD
jgi:hypothetical protein